MKRSLENEGVNEVEASDQSAVGSELLSVEGLTKHFPIKGGVLSRHVGKTITTISAIVAISIHFLFIFTSLSFFTNRDLLFFSLLMQ